MGGKAGKKGGEAVSEEGTMKEVKARAVEPRVTMSYPTRPETAAQLCTCNQAADKGEIKVGDTVVVPAYHLVK